MIRIKPVLTALVALAIFVAAFMAFLVAPLLLVVVVIGSMWGYQRWSQRGRRPGVRALSTPRSLSGEAARPGENGEQSFGFGAGLGRDL